MATTTVMMNPYSFTPTGFTVDDSNVAPTIGALTLVDPDPYSTAVLTDSPFYYAPFNDSSGSTAVARVGSDATYVGSPTLHATGPSSRIPWAVALDGTDDCVTLPNLAFTGSASAQTIEFWAKIGTAYDSTSGSKGALIKDTTPNGGVFFGSATSLLTNEVVSVFPTNAVDERTGWSGITLSFGWHHICLTFTGTQNGWTLYVDGVSVGTKISNLSGARGFTAGSTFTFGRNTTTFYAFSGIAAFACYNSTLSAARVAAHYNASLAGPPVVASAVAVWWADDLQLNDADPVSAWLDRIGSRSASNTTTLRPLYAATGIGGKPAVDFDGTDDYLRYAAANGVSNASLGCVIAVCVLDNDLQDTNVWSSADEATTTRYILGGVTSLGTTIFSQRNGDSTDQIVGDDILDDATAYAFEWSTSGTASTQRRNNDLQTLEIVLGSNNGDWFSDTTVRDNFIIGALRRTTVSGPFNGKIALIIVADAVLSAGDRTTLYDWISSYYGITMS